MPLTNADNNNSIFEKGPQIDLSELISEAAQERNDASQTSGQAEENTQAVPYERFKEVNEAKKLAQQTTEAQAAQIEMLQRQMQAAQGQSYQQIQQTAASNQQTAQKALELLTAEERGYLENNLITDPSTTLNRLAEIIMERGVNVRVNEEVGKVRQEMNDLAGQFRQTMEPMVLSNFKSSKFSNQPPAVVKLFDDIVKFASQTHPGVTSDPQALENLRFIALGQAADQGLFQSANQQQHQNNQSIPFSEGAGNGGFGGLLPRQATQVPREVRMIAEKMGIKPDEAAKMYELMDSRGVFRNG